MATAQSRIVYSSVPNPLPGNVASEGPEAYAFSELGDGVALTTSTGFLQQISFVMSSWACQSGNWYSNNCVSNPGASFSQPLTVSVYSVDDSGPVPLVGSLLGFVTDTYNISYRPSSTPSLCNGDGSTWYSKKDKACYHGIAVELMANFTNQHITVPANGKIIVTVAFNTTHYGYSPIGESAPCYHTSAGCPYDSLNISTDTTDGNFQFIGGPLDPNGIFVNYTLPNNSCTGTIQTGVLVDDTAPGCWAGYHPEFEIKANTKANQQSKADRP
jgi:hypothetical protein